MGDNFIKGSNNQSIDPKKDKDFKVNWTKVQNTSSDNFVQPKNSNKKGNNNVLNHKLKDKNYLEKSRKAVISEINKEKGRNDVNKKNFWGFLSPSKDVRIKDSAANPYIKEKIEKNNDKIEKEEAKSLIFENNQTEKDDDISFFELLFGRKKKKSSQFSNNLLKSSQKEEKEKKVPKVEIPQETSLLPNILPKNNIEKPQVLKDSKEKVKKTENSLVPPRISELPGVLPKNETNFYQIAENKKQKSDLSQKKGLWSNLFSKDSKAEEKISEPKKETLLPPKKIEPKQDTASVPVPKNEVLIKKQLQKKEIPKKPISEKESKYFVKPAKGQGIIKTNLIQKQRKEHNHQSRYILILMSIIIGLIILGGAYGGVAYWTNKYIIVRDSLKKANEGINIDIDKLKKESEKTSIFRKKLAMASYLLDNHVYLTQFLDFLEEETLPDVYYTGGFSGGVSDTYKFPVITKDFKTMETQVEVFKASDYVVEASYTGGNISQYEEVEGEPWYTFDLELVINPDIFYAK